ncbi:hypothetical protein F7725_015814, partial [Dissostichus mawsoni]
METSFAVNSFLLALLLSLHLHCHLFVWAAMDSCLDEEGAPSRCMPKFENIAFNRTVVVSNVCGSPPEDYCMQTGSTRSCHHCDASYPELSHNASLLTDFHMDKERTWWQSQSMFYGVQHPNSVNITLHLELIISVFHREGFRDNLYTIEILHQSAGSFAIYKRTEQNGTWLPYQYYSASCRKTYGKDDKEYIRPGGDERNALCTDEFRNVAFSTLEGRPSAYNFDQSVVLKEWVTATDLLISLDRLNTFGDEFFKDAKVLRSYFYAISDFSVGGRCKCNGHASECFEGEHGGWCVPASITRLETTARDVTPFTRTDPGPGPRGTLPTKCNCSGRSDECVFDVEQYRSTGRGGRCVSCRDHTDGPHCERCRENHYRRSDEEPCLPCNCNINGSLSLQCDVEGRCACKNGVTGAKCDTCRAGFHSLGPGGCRPCDCASSGSVGVCSALGDDCHCKPHVEGQSCDRCRPGFFNLQHVNTAGCQACFCFGHSLACSPSNHYTAVQSHLTSLKDGWLGEFSGGQEYSLLWKEGEVFLLPLTEEDIGFYKAPEHSSIGTMVQTPRAQANDFECRNSWVIRSTATPSSSPSPSPPRPPSCCRTTSPCCCAAPESPSLLTFHPKQLHESEIGFKPALSAFEFQQLLYNLTSLRISNAGGQNYTSQLAEVSLISASISSGPPNPPAPWVEFCSCPPGFAGQFCERCAPGFTREDPSRGPLSTCVPCNCHGHGTCHPETGVCECSDFTTGMTCEHCLDGYYGNALIGTPADCQHCPCPDRTSCAEIAQTGQVVCTNCPAGQTGIRCQMCEDGYYGDPLGQSGSARPCVRCDCNGNVDLNALGVCDHLTGRCLKCLGHTEGEHCERCQRGFYGDALNQTAVQKCKACSCSPGGTSGYVNECHPHTGNCLCLGHVTGRDCSYCEMGFFNLQPGVGWQCVCRAGVEGTLCDSCRVGFFGFSSRACNCDPMGSVSMQCHGNGTCHCREGFVGYKCDKCELNYYHSRDTHQCEECPVCYGLVKKQAEKLRTRLQDLEKLLAHFDCRGRFGKQHHLLKYHMAKLYEHEHQREDSLPNALEDFLAFQEAREAFIKQFSLLEASAGSLLAQLNGITTTLNCSISMTEMESGTDEGSRGVCQAFTDTLFIVMASQKQLKQATLDLDSMIIPFEMVSGPNKWNTMREMAEHMEAVASRAVRASEQTFSFLMDLLQDNSTEEYIRSLTEQITQMQQQKGNLTVQVNETAAKQLALEEEAAGLKIALGNITSSLHQLALTVASPSAEHNQTHAAKHTTEVSLRSTCRWGEDLFKQTEELDRQIQTKDNLVRKMREEMEPLKQTANKKLEIEEDISELRAHAQGSKVMALTSVVRGKEVESEAIALHRELQYMVREWPRQQAQTKASIRKEKPLEEKVLADVRRRVSQIKEMLEPALQNSSLSSNITQQAEHTAHAVAKESKAILIQAKHTRTASAHLSSHIDSALQQLSEQELQTDRARSLVTAEPQVSLAGVKEDMEAARLQLKAFSVTLTELISKIDGNVPLERFDRILDETERRLSMLRGSVDSPTLGVKIQKLRSAAQEQHSRMSLIEQDLQEITEERDSLRDIALNLP